MDDFASFCLFLGVSALVMAAISGVVFFVAPVFFAAAARWERKVSRWRDAPEKPAQLPQQAEIERLADELTEAHAEIQRLRTRLAERGGMR